MLLFAALAVCFDPWLVPCSLVVALVALFSLIGLAGWASLVVVSKEVFWWRLCWGVGYYPLGGIVA